MKILVACEFSGTVRRAFKKQGFHAVSCDLIPAEDGGEHRQVDVREILNEGWDAMIAFPPCTYLCSSGLHWNKRRPERAAETERALDFVRTLMDAPIPRIAIENPIGCISSRISDLPVYRPRPKKRKRVTFPVSLTAWGGVQSISFGRAA